MAKLSKALRTDLNEMAALLRSKGRNGDTILAHINPEEAALLKRRGGSGKPNPYTGLPEFQEEYAMFGGDTPAQEFVAGGGAAPEVAPVEAPSVSASPQYYGVDTATGSYGPGGELLGSWSPELGAYASPQYANVETPFASYGPQGQVQGVYSPELGMYTSQAGFPTGGAPETPGAIAPGVTPPGEEKGALDKMEEWLRKHPGATSALGALGKFGIGALGTLPIRQQARTAQQQAQTMGQEISDLGAQARTQGKQMLAQAQAGQLTPAQQQQIEAARAQSRQAMERAGVTSGVAAQQSEANVQRLVQQYVSNNISDALKMINLGDTWAAKGITAGYNASQTANQAANMFYSNLLGLVGGYQPRFPGQQ